MTNSGALRRQLSPLEPLVNQIEEAGALDEAGQKIAQTVRNAVPSGAVKDALSGTWLGHAVHPMLTDVVIGSFMSASLVDLLGPGRAGRASQRLIAVGLAAYLPTAATGINDWADTEPVSDQVRRAGLVHAGCNAVAATFYGSSWSARRRGARTRGKILGLAGMTVLMAGGYLGGHMSLRRGVGPDQTVFDPGPTDWTAAGEFSQLPEHEPHRVVVDDTPVMLVRDGDTVSAIHDRCSHRGCSLSQGALEGDEIVCACHGSGFDRHDGSVTRGPASAPQPAFEVRRRDGLVEIRRVQLG